MDELKRRWAEPAKPLAVTENPGTALYDGVAVRHELDTTWAPGDIQRFREGRLCIQCWEPFETPFPKECPVCRFEVKKFQRQVFEEQFEGDDEFLGPSTSWGEELDRLDDTHEKRIWREYGSQGILVPKNL